jgi:hypothetical protein
MLIRRHPLYGTAVFFAAFVSINPAARAQTAAAAPAVTPPAAAVAATTNPERVDAAVMARLRDEALNRSQVMKIAEYLTDVNGPRLTGSAGQKRASLWAQTTLAGWGLSNVRQEKWGPFERGWELERFSAQVTAPAPMSLIAAPKAWSPGLRRPLEADAVFLDATTVEQLAAYKGRLRGKAVLTVAPREVTAHFEPLGQRYTDTDLARLSQPPDPGGTPRRRQSPGGTPASVAVLLRFAAVRSQFLKDEGVALVIDAGRGDGGTLFVQQASGMYGPDVPQASRRSVWEKDAPTDTLPQMTVAAEQYNRLVRQLKAGEKVRLAVDLRARFTDTAREGLVANTVADLPGTDRADEVVMGGAHLDSWHSATGATDNAAGVAVCMEAMRLLRTLDLKPRRTIRIALWTGEEQGLFGSRAYVAEHFGTEDKPKPEHSKLSAYFNLDNGTGKIRGVWGQGNAAALPVFSAWLTPFADLGATTVTTRNTGSTDHVPFDRVGLPGFQFIQDDIEYFTRTHHSNQDSYDRLQEADLKQASLVMAAFLYNAAMRDDLLPRKPPASAAPAGAASPAVPVVR